MRTKRGFTLIELLVVISIISLLSSVILSSLNTARGKARDANRIAQAKQIQLALEQYYLTNGNYPYGGWINSTEATWQTNYLATALEPYMPTLPVDPVNNSSSHQGLQGLAYSYYSMSYVPAGEVSSASNNHWYMLMFNLEGNEVPYRQLDPAIACNDFNFTNAYTNSIVWGGCVK